MVSLNPPIRGSIEGVQYDVFYEKTSQSPYKGFNRKVIIMKFNFRNVSQSPYKGFNS